ncbi:MAG TPA: FHA domain-containing protein [Burkholderiales bacterium]|nr:FHA domain-containing protein [Burkholderiales bacterium]
MAKLVIKLNNNIVDHVELRQGDMKIGRKSSCDIHLDNLSVSGEHANIFTIGDDSFVQDLGSTNGTYVNNKKVAKHHLKNEDQVAVGKYRLTFVNDAARESTAFAKTVAITGPSSSDTPPVPPPAKKAPAVPGGAALISLSGSSTPGKRTELIKTVTSLGKAGKHGGTITRTPDGYLLAPGDNETPKLNGRKLSGKNTKLRNGDIIEVAGTRLQFHLK